MPDPRNSNPELFTLLLPDAPIPQFASAMQAAGIKITAEQLLQQGLEIQAITDTDGKEYEIATAYLDPEPSQQGEPLEGNYPLLIKQGNEWEKATLANLADKRGMDFGAFLNLTEDFAPITFLNFTTGGAFISWKIAQPSKEIPPDFSTDADYNIYHAAENGLSVSGNLIWGGNVPDWVSNEPDVRAVMRNYIEQVMTHYDVIQEWGVYNEAQLHGSDDIFWEKGGGIEAVRDAFQTAKTINPSAKRIYSDFVDLDGTVVQDRLPIIEQVINQLIKDGTIDEIALQVVGRMRSFDLEKLASTLETLTQYGLPICVKEFSIIIDGENNPQNLQQQAELGAKVIRILERHGIIEVVVMPLEDRLANKMYFDEANSGFWLQTEGVYIPKPIVYAIMKVLIEEPED
jgi:GH35 family endo-1,4-beta-xylanase